jgi:hypothetical protein
VVIIQLNHVLKKVRAKVVDLRAMDDLKHDVAITLMLLGEMFPLSFSYLIS